MSKALMKSLKADLPTLAEMIRSKGRGRDTMLAHITPREAALLKRRGGSGSINPDTGLPEFDDGVDAYSYGNEADIAAQNAANQTPEAPVSPVYDIVQQGGGFTQVDPATQTGQQYTPGGDSYAPVSAPTYTQQDILNTQNLNPIVPTSLSGPVPQGQALSTGGTAYAPQQLSQSQLNQLASGQALAEYPGSTDTTSTDKTSTDKEKQSYLDKLLSGDTLAKLGLSGLLGYGLTKGVAKPAAQQATQQSQQAAQQYQQLAQPYRDTGQNLITSAQTGALTPSNLQAVNTARQIAGQNIKSRGGVGVEQAANQVAQLEANLLEQQFSTGLSLMNIADKFDAQAIQTSLSANQSVVGSNAAFYTQLANMLAPFVFGTGQMTSPTQPRTTTTGV